MKTINKGITSLYQTYQAISISINRSTVTKHLDYNITVTL